MLRNLSVVFWDTFNPEIWSRMRFKLENGFILFEYFHKMNTKLIDWHEFLLDEMFFFSTNQRQNVQWMKGVKNFSIMGRSGIFERWYSNPFESSQYFKISNFVKTVLFFIVKSENSTFSQRVQKFFTPLRISKFFSYETMKWTKQSSFSK